MTVWKFAKSLCDRSIGVNRCHLLLVLLSLNSLVSPLNLRDNDITKW